MGLNLTPTKQNIGNHGHVQFFSDHWVYYTIYVRKHTDDEKNFVVAPIVTCQNH